MGPKKLVDNRIGSGSKAILVMCLFSFILCGCESKPDKQKATRVQKEKTDQFIKDFMAEEDREKITLLSLKYDIEEAKVEGILNEYRSQIWSQIYTLLFHEVLYDTINLNFQETLNKLARKYNIPKDKLAGMIIDYKIWEACESKIWEACESE